MDRKIAARMAEEDARNAVLDREWVATGRDPRDDKRISDDDLDMVEAMNAVSAASRKRARKANTPRAA